MKNAPGQRLRPDFPRFGLNQFADRIVQVEQPWSVTMLDEQDHQVMVNADRLSTLTRVEQTSDFHCVTTWSAGGLCWSGYRLRDVFDALREELALVDAEWLFVRSLDGYRSRLPLVDALAPDVLLADRLNGEPLDVAHGAPLRLVAPQHYGFKSAKHLREIRFLRESPNFDPVVPMRFMEHPRGRVALEERGLLPGRLLRWLYRPLVSGTVKKFARALERGDVES